MHIVDFTKLNVLIIKKLNNYSISRSQLANERLLKSVKIHNIMHFKSIYITKKS